MTDPQPPGSGLTITLKDVWAAQQQFKDRQVESEKRLTETFMDLKLTLNSIQQHLSGLDARNAAADELHREQGRRISDVEHVMDTSGLRTLREDLLRLITEQSTHLSSLEKYVAATKVVSQTVADARKSADEAKHRARQSLWGMVAAVGTALLAVVTLVVWIQSHR